MSITDMVQTADWRTEKHVPVIECPDKVSPGELFELKASLGKEVSHPNTTEHHIRWIKILFKPRDSSFVYEIGNFEFTAHGESVNGPDKGPVYTGHSVACFMKSTSPGKIVAMAYCNIHGLWENTRELELS